MKNVQTQGPPGCGRAAQHAVAAVLLLMLVACGGGGGGGDASPPANPGSGSATGLVPAAPTIGDTLFADAGTLRPVRNGATWRYSGSATTSGVTQSYETTTVQSAASTGSVTESTTNSSNDGSSSTVVDIAAGQFSTTETIDFALRPPGETLKIIELRSPVRQGDQITIFDRRYTDTGIDVDRDGRTDTLDLAIYVRVIGLEPVTLTGLPTVTAVRVDTTIASRIRPTSTNVFEATVEARVQVWYAPGIGIVRQSTTIPSAGSTPDTTDERLLAYDGVTAGFGALSTQQIVVPADSPALAGQFLPARGTVAALPFADHVLLLHTGPSAEALATQFDLRGRAITTRLLPLGLSLGGATRIAQTNDGALILDGGGASGALTMYFVTRLNTDGTLNGVLRGLALDLTGGEPVASVSDVPRMAWDGTSIWLLYNLDVRRIVNGVLGDLAKELVLRPFDLNGNPLRPGTVLAQDALPVGLSARDGQVLATFQRNTSGDLFDVSLARTGNPYTAVESQTLATGVVGSNSFPIPMSLSDGAAVVWSAELGTGANQASLAGVRIDAGGSILRGASTLQGELLAGVPTFSSETSAPAAVGNRLVFSTFAEGSGARFSGNSGAMNTLVSWLDAPASQPLNALSVSSLRLSMSTPTAQAAYGDRVLVFGGSNTLETTLVWLNNGSGS